VREMSYVRMYVCVCIMGLSESEVGMCVLGE